MVRERAGRVDQKVALVTGAGTGIGRAVCVRLAEEGASVIVTSRSPEHVAQTCALVEEQTGQRPLGLPLDVADSAAVRRVVADVVRQHGRIDIVSNNAGIDYPHEPLVDELTDDEWETMLRVNLTGVFYVCRAAIASMPPGSAIVNVGSGNSLSARANAAAYVASKGGVLQLTRAMALDLAPRGIRSNCVCPGVIDTPLTDIFLDQTSDPIAARAGYAASNPMNRLGTPEEVANCVLFLASDEASFVTGAALVVDGGSLA